MDRERREPIREFGRLSYLTLFIEDYKEMASVGMTGSDIKAAFRDAYNLVVSENPESTVEYFSGLIKRMQSIMSAQPNNVLLPYLMGAIYEYLDLMSKKGEPK